MVKLLSLCELQPLQDTYRKEEEMNDRDIEDTRMPPDQFGFCENCQVKVDAGDMQQLDTKWYCENCIREAKDAAIPEGKFCELPDGYPCPYLNGQYYNCNKHWKRLSFDHDEYAPIKCADCR